MTYNVFGGTLSLTQSINLLKVQFYAILYMLFPLFNCYLCCKAVSCQLLNKRISYPTCRVVLYVIVALGDHDMDDWFARLKFISSIVIPIVFSIVFILGLIGNGTLIYTILANKWMRTKSNVLIVSLAGGDFLLILVSVPFAALLYITDGWWFGQLTCKVC